MTFDVFDGNELHQSNQVIDGNIGKNTSRFEIRRGFAGALFPFECISFLLLPIEIIGKLVVEDEENKEMFSFCTACYKWALEYLDLTGIHLFSWLRPSSWLAFAPCSVLLRVMVQWGTTKRCKLQDTPPHTTLPLVGFVYTNWG